MGLFCGIDYLSALGLVIGLLSITNILFLLSTHYDGVDDATHSIESAKEYFSASYNFVIEQSFQTSAGDDELLAGLDDDYQYQIDDDNDGNNDDKMTIMLMMMPRTMAITMMTMMTQ